jgi:hypothetical protein
MIGWFDERWPGAKQLKIVKKRTAPDNPANSNKSRLPVVLVCLGVLTTERNV